MKSSNVRLVLINLAGKELSLKSLEQVETHWQKFISTFTHSDQSVLSIATKNV